ncbi:UNVERIFIED_ORG: hypothetical protein ABIC43_002702 [Variovorax guangxiensis]
MPLLSDSMCAAVALPNGSSPKDLLDNLGTSAYDFLDGLLVTEQARIDAEQALGDRDDYHLQIAPQIGLIQERFCLVTLNGVGKPALVGLLSNEPERALPTALENLLFWAISDPLLPWQAQWKQTNDGLVSDWRTQARGYGIVAMPVGAAPESVRTISALFGLKHSEIGVSLSAAVLVDQATAISISAVPADISLVQARLINEASTVAHPKWRCLALYRILEHAYLSNIKRKLLLDFDADAGGALQEALDKVSNEVNQLVSLAEDADLTVEFEQFNVAFDAQLSVGNNFIIKLDRGAKSHQLYRAQERYKKAVLRFYKLRCAIAHAGTSSVIYEQFADSDQAATALLPSIEAIALKSLKISK